MSDTALPEPSRTHRTSVEQQPGPPAAKVAAVTPIVARKRARKGPPGDIARSVGLRGEVSPVGWALPDNLSEAEWRDAGRILGRVERSVAWWIGDWWAFGEARYGERKALVEGDDWDGPSFATCVNAATVCGTFESPRRRGLLGFTHHAEVAGLPPVEADRLLDWAEETIVRTGKPRATRELRAEVSKMRVTVGAQPSGGTCTLDDLPAPTPPPAPLIFTQPLHYPRPYEAPVAPVLAPKPVALAQWEVESNELRAAAAAKPEITTYTDDEEFASWLAQVSDPKEHRQIADWLRGTTPATVIYALRLHRNFR